MTMLDHELLARLADELDLAREQIETLGTALCRKADLARQVLTELQSLDHIGQRCATIAEILRAPDMHVAGTAAGLDTIRFAVAPALADEPHSSSQSNEFFWDDTE